MQLIDAVALYGNLCMTNGADGISKPIPDYDVDKKHITIKMRDVRRAIISAPTVDAVEVVRCKDCNHKGWIQEPCHGKSVDFCNVFDSTINNPEKCFCYYGERRSDDGK